MRVGFYAWNPFQIYQVESIARHIPGAEYIVEKRGNIDFDRIFAPAFLKSLTAPVHYIRRGDMAALDERYDVVVCQTPFGRMEDLKRAKVVGMQYSMTKERHQHGAWRALCDLNLVYGRYSYDRISPFSPCAMVGNPRFDRWFESGLDAQKTKEMRQTLDPARKTVLYLPTWGGLSSIPAFGKAVAALAEKQNVIAKVHHKTDTHELSKKNILNEDGLRRVFGAADDMLYLMQCADVVLSDYSGAMFDAINLGKPVVLLQQSPESVVGAEKFGLESIEYARRGEIGPVVEKPEDLAGAVESVLNGIADYKAANARLRAECFSQQGGSGKAAADAIRDLLENSAVRPFHQVYLADTLKEYRRKEEGAKALPKIIHAPRRLARAVFAPFNARLLKVLCRRVFKLLRRGFYGGNHAVAGMIDLCVRRGMTPPSRVLGLLCRVVNSFVLRDLAERYDTKETRELALFFSSRCFEKSRKTGLSLHIRLLEKAGRREEIESLIDTLLKLPTNARARVLSRLERAQEIVKSRAPVLRRARHEIYSWLKRELAEVSGRKRVTQLMQILVSNRWLEDARKLSFTVALEEEARLTVLEGVHRAERRMGKWYFLTEVANANHRPDLSAGGFQCLYKGEVSTVAQARAEKIVEFFLPPYFFEPSVSHQAAHDRICTMLRRVLSALEKEGVAIVPRHQFRLNDADPSGHWPALSYHTTGSMPGWRHLKDGHIPGYFSLDEKGYSGWSSLAGIQSLPPMSSAEIEETWHKLRRRFVEKKKSKYDQQDIAFVPPARPYVFLPLQLQNDAVADLADIDGPALAGLLARHLPELGYNLVLKRHPLCDNAGVERLLEDISKNPHVHVTVSSIHDVLPGALAVATVNFGTGFESLLHGKRVLLTGAADYAFAATRISSEGALQKALTELKEPVDLDRIKRFLHFYTHHYAFDYEDNNALSRHLSRLFAAPEEKVAA